MTEYEPKIPTFDKKNNNNNKKIRLKKKQT